MSHSPLAPSSAPIWAPPDGCRGSVAMQAAYPETEESEESREGTAAHEAGAILIEGREHPNAIVGRTASNGVVIDRDMVDAALVFSDDVKKTRIANGGMLVATERRIAMPSIHSVSSGTVDCFGYSTDTLYVWDFKYGFKFVDAYENWQLLNYVFGLATERTERIVMRLVQPRAYSPEGVIREWSVTGEQLKPYLQQLRQSAAEAMAPNAPTRTGSHCYKCSARHACSAALRAGMGQFETVGQSVPQELDPVALSIQLAMIARAHEQLGFLLTGFEERAKALIKSGKLVPGWGLKPGKGKEVWTVDPKTIYGGGDQTGVDLRNVKPITPKQARDAGFDSELLDAWSERRPGALKISQVKPNDIKRIFES